MIFAKRFTHVSAAERVAGEGGQGSVGIRARKMQRFSRGCSRCHSIPDHPRKKKKRRKKEDKGGKPAGNVTAFVYCTAYSSS